MSIDLDGPEPLYEQIAEVLTSRIADGTYPVRRRLPSTAALCDEFGVSRPTAERALQMLVDQGLAITQPGKGRFVAERGEGG